MIRRLRSGKWEVFKYGGFQVFPDLGSALRYLFFG